MPKTIFIQIASYRDPELLPTLKSCIENAKWPKNLRFCIAWQHSEEDEWDKLDKYKNNVIHNLVLLGNNTKISYLKNGRFHLENFKPLP
jgi:hypothetical protein